jgi:hypothetical protein
MNNEIGLRYFFFGPPLVCGGVSSGALPFLGDIRDAAIYRMCRTTRARTRDGRRTVDLVEGPSQRKSPTYAGLFERAREDSNL